MIHSAKISTYGERAVDAFYVQNALGDKVEGEARQKKIRAKLLDALVDAEDGSDKLEKKSTKANKKPARQAPKKRAAKTARAAAR